MATTIRSSTQLYVDANFDFKNNKGVNLTPGTASGHAVEYDQMNTAISNAVTGVGNAIHVPVADLAAAKAVTDYTDRMLMLIETMGLYRFDAESLAASNDNTVIRPTNIASDTNPGRWIKMSATITDHNLLSGLQGGTTGEYYHLTAAEAGLLAGSALTKVDDTNVTLTLGGTPASALLKAVSLTLGWTGTLADSRIASAATWNAKVDSVTAGTGIKQNGTAKAPILDIVSAAGTAGSVGTIVVTADAIGVALGTTSTTAAAGNHTHAGMGTVLSVGAGNGLTDSGTATAPVLNVASHAGTAGTVGTLVITADSVGVALGSTSTTAAPGNHNHTVDSLSNVTITTIADNNILAWDSTSSKWINQSASELGLLTGNQSITLTGEATGTGTTSIAVTLTNSAVIGKVLTGYTATSGTITASDSILTAIQKLGYDKHVPVTLAANSGLTLSTQQLAMGTPSSITSSSTNSVTTSTHTHAITASLGFIGNGTAQYQTLVTGATPFAPVWTTSANLFGTGGLNALTYASTSFVKMTGANTFTLDTNTYLTANQTITLSGDVSGSGTTAITTTIGANKVTLAMMAQVSSQVFLGRNTASTGNVEVLNMATAKTMLGLNTSNLSSRTYRVVPTGSINGSNNTFTIAANVLSGTEEVYKNGILQNAGAGNDYTITYGATTTITFATAPSSTPFADIILVNYSV